MRHRVAGYKLGRTAAHRKAMTQNMMNSLIEHERITTTVPKAKHLRPIIEKIITIGKNDTQANRRRAFAKLRDKESVKKLFGVLGPRFAERQGGYCRILKLSKPRLGDAGEQAIIEFVERTVDESSPEELAKATEELAEAKATLAASKAELEEQTATKAKKEAEIESRIKPPVETRILPRFRSQAQAKAAAAAST